MNKLKKTISMLLIFVFAFSSVQNLNLPNIYAAAELSKSNATSVSQIPDTEPLADNGYLGEDIYSSQNYVINDFSDDFSLTEDFETEFMVELSDSEKLTVIANTLGITEQEAVIAAENHGDIESVLAEADVIETLQFDYPSLDEQALEQVAEFVVEGYKATDAVYAGMAAEVLDLNVEDIIASRSEVAEMIEEGNVVVQTEATATPVTEVPTEIPTTSEEVSPEITTEVITEEQAEAAEVIPETGDDEAAEILGETQPPSTQTVPEVVTVTQLSPEDTAIIDELAFVFSVKPEALVTYITENEMAANELGVKLANYQLSKDLFIQTQEDAESDNQLAESNAISTQNEMSTMSAANSVLPGGGTVPMGNLYKGYPSATFDFRNSGSEIINNNTGSMLYEIPIGQVPGLAGLDLDISLQYDLSIASPEIIKGQVLINNYSGYNYTVRAVAFPHWPLDEGTRFERQKDFPTLQFNSYSMTDYQTALQMVSELEAGMYSSALLNNVLLNNQYPLEYWVEFNTGSVYQNKYFKIYAWVEASPQVNYANGMFKNVAEGVFRSNLQEFSGIGWVPNFDRIVRIGNDRYLKLSNGSTYALKEIESTPYGTEVSLEGYEFNDMTLTDLDQRADSEVPGSGYVLKFKDGSREYFAEDGRLHAIFDKFGNKTWFDGSVKDSTRRMVTTIHNSAGKQVEIDSPWFFYVGTLPQTDYTYITFPDGSKITLEFRNFSTDPLKPQYLLVKKTDQVGQVTQFEYEKVQSTFKFFQDSLCNVPGTTTYFNLKKVIYPTTATTEYNYTKTTSQTSIFQTFEYFKLASRNEKGDSSVYNNKFFSYTGDSGSYLDLYDSNYTYSTSITEANGLVSKYTYDNRHRLKSTEILENSTSKVLVDYTYPPVGGSNPVPPMPTNIKTRVNGSSSITTQESFQYDSYCNLVSQWSTLTEGNKNNTEYKTTYTYDNTTGGFNMPTSKTYKKDAVTTIREVYELTSDRKSVASAKVYANDVLKARTDFTYDNYGRLLTEKSYYSGSDYIETVYTYGSGPMPLTKTTAGATETFTYDAMGRVLTHKDAMENTTTFTYDAKGRMTRTDNPPAPTASSKTVAYNDALNTLTTTDENGTQLKYTYDKLGNVKSLTDLSDNSVLASFNYDAKMRLLSETDAMGLTTSYTYDFRDRPLTITNGVLYKENYVYNDAVDASTSKVEKTIDGSGTAAPSIKTAVYTDKHGRTVKDSILDGSTEIYNTYSYDYLGNKTQEQSANDRAAGRAFTAKYETDVFGNVTKLTQADNSFYLTEYDSLGRKVKMTDPKGGEFKFVYDALGRLSREEMPFEGTVYSWKDYSYDKNGNLTKLEASNGEPGTLDTSRTDYAYDTRNRLTKVNSHDNGVVTSFVEYAYDNVGNKTEMKTANGTQVTKYEYDRFSRLKKLTDALNQFEEYTYDKNGNLLTKLDRNKNITTTTYDLRNRPLTVRVTKPGGTQAAEFIDYSYAKTSELLTEQNESLTTTNSYDNLGRLIKQTESNGTEKTYTYDLANNRKTFILKLNNVTQLNNSYDYDAMNRLWKVSDNGVLSATYTYDVNGNRSNLALANGTTTEYSYNRANLVTNLTNKKVAAVLSSYAYAYNLDGNQSAKTDHTGLLTSYQYDDLGRLTRESETGGITKAYQFDLAGNRSKMTVSGTESYFTTYACDKNNRLLTETKYSGGIDTTASYHYDKNGNQLSKMTEMLLPQAAAGTPSLGIFMLGEDVSGLSDLPVEINNYDTFNRLSNVVSNKGTTTYTYKPDGLRLSKSVNGEQIIHIWDGSNIVYESNGNKYIRGINLIKDNTNFFLFNAHGDVVNLTNASGVTTKEYRYDAFGVEKNPSAGDTNPWRYCGEYFDKETGSVYLRARYYDPATGRFSAEDPIRDGLNWYTYCINNPIVFTDPSGMAPHLDIDFTGRAGASPFTPVDWEKFALQVRDIAAETAGILAAGMVIVALGPAGNVIAAFVIGGTGAIIGYTVTSIGKNEMPTAENSIGAYLTGGTLNAISYAVYSLATASGAVDDILTTSPRIKTTPQDYLDDALNQQGLTKAPAGLKQEWTEGGYKYTVRIHAGESQYTNANSIYRVSRQQITTSGQGAGTYYLGTDGNWYHTSVLKETIGGGRPNPLYNPNAAKITHIPLQ